jgi:DNA-binding HxlR family transcriptional regulator
MAGLRASIEADALWIARRRGASPETELAREVAVRFNRGMQASYKQFCPVAKAAEIFANRWTPLVLRELLAGAQAFNDIHRGVPLMSRAMLVARLRELEHLGIVERRPRADRGGHDYRLTAAGEAFRPVVSALAHWGLAHARDRIGPADLDPTVLMWSLRRRVDRGLLPPRRVVVQFEFLGVPARYAKLRILWLVLQREGVEVCVKNPGHDVDATLRGSIGDLVAVYLGQVAWRDVRARFSLDGDQRVVRGLPAWLRLDKVVGRDFPPLPPAAVEPAAGGL